MASRESEQEFEEMEPDINSILISLVKEHSFIYDARDAGHKDRHLLERTWSVIAAQINLSVEETKTKWQRLRNNFSKAIERRVKAPRSGSAATKLQRPWAYEAEMEFIRSHLHNYRTSFSTRKRRAPVSEDSHSQSSLYVCPQPIKSDITEHLLDTLSDHTAAQDTCNGVSTTSNTSKQTLNELDSAVLSYIQESFAKKTQEEDPAIGWFKSLLPMFNTLSQIEKLEFQAKMTLELRSLMLADEQRMQSQSMTIPPNSTSSAESSPSPKENYPPTTN